MTWTSLIKAEMEYAYAVAGNLMKLVDDSELSWKPATGTNWMTTGQLFYYLKLQGKPVHTGHLWGM